VKGIKDDTYSKELVEIMCKHFSESKRNVLYYLSLMSKEEMKAVVGLYGYTEKELNSIISD
jgi:hypothetical protein